MKEQRKQFRGRFTRPFAVAAAATAILAVGPIAATAGASSTNVKSNKQPITVGVNYDQSGSAGPTTFSPRYQAFVATVKWINANGGVNGHQINLITQDDAQSEPGSLTATQSLVQNDGALMIVNISGEQTGAIWASQQGIPVDQNPQSSVVSQYNFIWTPNGGDNPDPTLWTDNVAVFLKRHGFH